MNNCKTETGFGPAKAANSGRPSFKVFIVYEDNKTARAALKVFGSLVDRYGDRFEFFCELWQFDVLCDPDLSPVGVILGNAADLLMVSTDSGCDLPMAVRSCIRRAVRHKAPGSAALVAVVQWRPGRGKPGLPAVEFLKGAALEAKIDFFLHEVLLVDSSAEEANEN